MIGPVLRHRMAEAFFFLNRSPSAKSTKFLLHSQQYAKLPTDKALQIIFYLNIHIYIPTTPASGSRHFLG